MANVPRDGEKRASSWIWRALSRFVRTAGCYRTTHLQLFNDGRLVVHQHRPLIGAYVHVVAIAVDVKVRHDHGLLAGECAVDFSKCPR